MRKTIIPSEHIFVFRLSDGECHKELTGVCSLDKAFVHSENNGEEGIAYCQNLYKSLVESGQFNRVTLVEATCGHFEFNDGQHRVCIAQRKGLKIKADIFKVDFPCRNCEPPKYDEAALTVDLDEIVINDLQGFEMPEPETVPEIKSRKRVK